MDGQIDSTTLEHYSDNMKKEHQIILILALVAVGMYALFNYLKAKRSTQNTLENNLAAGGIGSGNNFAPVPNLPGSYTPPSSSSSPQYPVRSLQSPFLRGDDIREMQKSYNRVVDMRVAKNANTPTWSKISVDGVYGPQTDAAMRRLMNMTEVKLNQVLNKEQWIKTVLNA